MASISTLRAGAGAVILGTPRSIYPVMAKRLTEVMIEPLPETHAGSLSLNSFESIQEKIAWADVLVLGPGLSRNAETQQLIRRIVAGCKKPMLLDADALNALAEKNSMLKKHKSPDVIITPHAGELSRLIGKNAIEIEKNRVETSRKVAKEFGVTLVLKGAPTVTSSEHGEVYINSTGNAGMATAGSGDVLSGIIAGLWAQGMSRLEAAYAGVFVHGYAGDLAKKKFGERSLMATDIQELLPDALTEIERALNRC
jgi:NAD(P)H-hydrate epimerase